jgi:hypothetical protein
MDTIALNFERALQFRKDGNCREGKLIISHMEYLNERQAWACYWSLDFIKPDLKHFACGRDPLESLASALCMAHELVRDSGIANLQVWWKEPGDKAGLSSFVVDSRMRESRAP